MSKKELAKLTLIQAAIEGVYTVSEAAKSKIVLYITC
jgi:hypothetical protein